MRRFYAFVLSSVVTLSIIIGCSTKAVSTPAAVSQSTPAPVAQPVVPVPATSPEDPAWAKVVEAAKKEGEVTIYSYSFIGDVGIAISRSFKNRYGISPQIITGKGAEFFERVKTEKRQGHIVADMTEGSALHLMNMKREGLTLSSSELPVLREKDIWVADILGIDPQDKHVISFNFAITTPFVNSNLIKSGEEPKVWKDLLNPKWKGKMMLTDYQVSGGPYLVFVPLLREKVIDEEFIKALYKQDIWFAAGLPDEGSQLSRGERTISIRGIDSVYARFVAEGAPIRAIELSDGTVIDVLVTVLFNGSPHPNAAKVFNNWLLSPEGQSVYGKAANVASVRKDVTNFLPRAAQILPKRPIILTNDDNQKAAQLFREGWLDKLWGKK